MPRELTAEQMAEIGMTVEVVARRLTTTRRTVYRLIEDGLLECTDYPRIGKRVTEEQFQRFLAAHRAAS